MERILTNNLIFPEQDHVRSTGILLFVFEKNEDAWANLKVYLKLHKLRRCEYPTRKCDQQIRGSQEMNCVFLAPFTFFSNTARDRQPQLKIPPAGRAGGGHACQAIVSFVVSMKSLVARRIAPVSSS